MRSAEGCIIGLASVCPNFLCLTFDPQAGAESLSLSSSCQVSPVAEETHQAAASFPPHLLHLSFRRWLQLCGPPLVVTSLWLRSRRTTFGCRRRVEYRWRDGKGSVGLMRFDAFKLLLRAVVSFVHRARCPHTHFAWIDLFSVLSCSRGGFLSEGVFMFDFIVHEPSAALKFPCFSPEHKTKHADSLQTMFCT